MAPRSTLNLSIPQFLFLISPELTSTFLTPSTSCLILSFKVSYPCTIIFAFIYSDCKPIHRNTADIAVKKTDSPSPETTHL